jgi:asparagine synthase (glutamine-hydrolysing)
MCGVIGIINRSKKNSSIERVRAGLKAMRNRGPDASHIEKVRLAESEIIFGHNRLAIIDLSDDGVQPMRSACGRYLITFNGEIYNYQELRESLKGEGVKFKTNSDTEVLIEAWSRWGLKSLKMLRGMFSFAVLDELAHEIFIFRDAFGIKPLYYTSCEDSFIFASDLNSLNASTFLKAEPNISRINSYLIDGLYDFGDETFYKNVYRLPAGHYIKLDLNNPTDFKVIEWRTWNIKLASNPITFDQAVKNVRESFLETIRFHCLSDVPIGVSLSGGLDSSAIACAIKYNNPNIDCVSFSYISQVTSQSEEKWVDMVSSHTGFKNIKLNFSNKSFENNLDQFIKSQGEPVGTASIYAQYEVMKVASQNGIKVILEGQGADEVLGGYFGYPSAIFLDLIEEGDFWGIFKYFNAAKNHPNLSSKQLFNSLLKALFPNFARKYQYKSYAKLQSWIDIENYKNPSRSFVKFRSYNEKNKARNLYKSMLDGLNEGGLECLLRHGDRNSMAFSIENRVPFLDKFFVAPLLQYPNYYHVTKLGRTKNLFREAMRGIVPEEVLERKDKVGFEGPEKYLLGDFQLKDDEIQALIGTLKNLRYKNIEDVRKAFSEESNQRLKWRILNIAKWAKQNFQG